MGKYMTFYCGLSLKELRRRQGLVNWQIQYIFKIANDARRRSKERSLIRLQRIYRLLSAAVYKVYT